MKQLYLAIMIAMLVSACSRKSDAELFEEGKMAEGQQNAPLAIERYEDIVTRMSNPALAESSQFRIAMIQANIEKDKRKAVEAYKKFYALFPESKQAPTMLFLQGFIYANDIKDLSEARGVYEAFLQKYPDHELARSARFELDNLGKDPNDILPSNVVSGEAEAKGKRSVQ